MLLQDWLYNSIAPGLVVQQCCSRTGCKRVLLQDWLYNKLPDSTPNNLEKGGRSRAELEDQHNFFPVLDIKDVQVKFSVLKRPG